MRHAVDPDSTLFDAGEQTEGDPEFRRKAVLEGGILNYLERDVIFVSFKRDGQLFEAGILGVDLLYPKRKH